mgnify:CR=1 FL=1
MKKQYAGKQVVYRDVLGKLVDDLGGGAERDGVPLGEIAVNLPVRVGDGPINNGRHQLLPLGGLLNEGVPDDCIEKSNTRIFTREQMRGL